MLKHLAIGIPSVTKETPVLNGKTPPFAKVIDKEILKAKTPGRINIGLMHMTSVYSLGPYAPPIDNLLSMSLRRDFECVEQFDAVIDPIEPGGVMLAERIWTEQGKHRSGPAPALGRGTGFAPRRRKDHQRTPASRVNHRHCSQDNCPAGATFPGAVPEKRSI